MGTTIKHIRHSTVIFLLTLLAFAFSIQQIIAQGDTITKAVEEQYIEPGNISNELGKLLPELTRIGEIADSQGENINVQKMRKVLEIYNSIFFS